MSTCNAVFEFELFSDGMSCLPCCNSQVILEPNNEERQSNGKRAFSSCWQESTMLGGDVHKMRGDRDLKVTVCTDRSTSQHPTNNYARQASEKQSQGHHKTLENLEAARMSMQLF